MPRLKVFCTTSGFYDHVVAAPSRPAALKAWGARTDLFSMGVARLVTDPKIEKKAMDRPGEVIRIKRSGGEAEFVQPKRNKAKKAARAPGRTKLAAAEKRLAELAKKQDKEMAAIERELGALERKRDEIRKRHAKARTDAEGKAEQARSDYEAALAEWEPG